MNNLTENTSLFLEGNDTGFNTIALDYYQYINDKYFCQLWRILDHPANDIISLNMIFSLLESFHHNFTYNDKNKYEWYREHAFKSAKNWKSLVDLRNAIAHTTSPSAQILIDAGLLTEDYRQYNHNIENVFCNVRELFNNHIHGLVNNILPIKDKNVFLYKLLQFENDTSEHLVELKKRIEAQ